jgi:hypothetical protein
VARKLAAEYDGIAELNGTVSARLDGVARPMGPISYKLGQSLPETPLWLETLAEPDTAAYESR